ncbi:MAG TPA: contractile injection system protein, VgrG/Pvc8 family, partial [Paraburkholderia sp.]|uniref:contractile injection system protein, VgrG/Pvc8 family n=1 Tax=Paraburkholderia sp. TaxID=1926495 RepID=UPI002DE6F464|nr:contractile injection system protein, VgrG/Pvc8 family [Paraburkholderia sp.]
MNRSIPAAVFSTLTIQGQALPGDLAVRRLHGNEGTGRLFYYRVEVVAPHAESAPEFLMNPALELDQIRGTFATVAINLENIDLSAPILRGAGVREIGGLITEIRVLGVEKNAVVYEFTLRPSVWPATLRQNSRT